MLQLGDSQQIEILKFVHDTHRSEMAFHRDVMNSVFSWSTNLFIAIIGGVIAVGSERLNAYGINAKIVVSAIILIIAGVVIMKLRHSADAIDTNAKIVVKTDKWLGLFEKGMFHEDPLYPAKWTNWGKMKSAGYYAVYNSLITCIFAAITIAFLWLA